MSGKRLLDTNIVIALFANETAVKDGLAKTDEVFVPSVVIGELCYGVHKSTRAKENLGGLTTLPPAVWFWDVIQKLVVYTAKSKTAFASKGVHYPKTTFGLRQLPFSII